MTEKPLPAEITEETAEAEEPLAEGLVAGRPVEDRGFEMVEVGVGASLGLAIGAAVAGPIGAAAGGVIGAAAGLVAGEAIERAAGHAAETTDATANEPPRRA
jgi:outer membrane lipoprotein SlyB